MAVISVALLCMFVAGEPFEGTVVGTRNLPHQTLAGQPVTELETLLRSGYRFYRVIEKDDETYEPGETVELKQGPCDKKIG